jgi:hypothetical protein
VSCWRHCTPHPSIRSSSLLASLCCSHADVDFTATPAKYIRYAAADVAAIVDEDLFETKAVSMARLSLAKEKLGAIG